MRGPSIEPCGTPFNKNAKIKTIIDKAAFYLKLHTYTVFWPYAEIQNINIIKL